MSFLNLLAVLICFSSVQAEEELAPIDSLAAQVATEERVDEVIDCEIDERDIERLGLTLTGEFETIQHIELPEALVHVTEHRLTVYKDRDGSSYIPHCPELSGPIFGPRLLATSG